MLINLFIFLTDASRDINNSSLIKFSQTISCTIAWQELLSHEIVLTSLVQILDEAEFFLFCFVFFYFTLMLLGKAWIRPFFPATTHE